MFRVVLVLLSVVLLAIPASGQDESLQLADIFAPNVEIRYAEAAATGYASSDSRRVMIFGDHVLTYPADFGEVDIQPLADGTFFISNVVWNDVSYSLSYWRYDPNTAALTEAESQCAGRGFDRQFLNIVKAPWIIIGEDGADALCNVLTGERTLPLPTDRASFAYHYDHPYTDDYLTTGASPDGRYIVFTGLEHAGEGFSGWDVLYSYDLVTGEFMLLGTFPHQSAVRQSIDRWFGTAFTLIAIDTCGQCTKSVYLADAAHENSLIEGINSTFWPYFKDNPPRYVADDESFMDEYYCFMYAFDLTTRTRQSLDSPVGCRPDYGTFEGVGYYRQQATSTDLTQADSEVIVARYDAVTREPRDLFRGEVEHVRWVSSDDQYAIFLMDTNGRIDDSPSLASYMDRAEYGDAYWALIHLPSGSTMLTVPNAELANTSSRRLPQPQFQHLGIFPLPDGSFVTNTCESGRTICEHERSEHVIVTGDQAAVTGLAVNPVRLISGQAIMLETWPEPEAPFAYTLYNVVTEERIPLVRSLARPTATLRGGSDGEGGITVVVTETLGTVKTQQRFAVQITPDGLPVVILPATHRLPEQVAAQPVPTLAPVEPPSCVLTVLTGTNLRAGPGVEFERVGSAAVEFVLTAIGQTENAQDFFTWWQLDTGEWVREDFVREDDACAALPTVAP